jgi:hypothetical protein
VGDDVPSDRLRVVLRKAHAIRIRDDLVREDDSDSKLFRESGELTQELSQLHLSAEIMRGRWWEMGRGGENLSESSPRPWKSVRNRAVAESTIIKENLRKGKGLRGRTRDAGKETLTCSRTLSPLRQPRAPSVALSCELERR